MDSKFKETLDKLGTATEFLKENANTGILKYSDISWGLGYDDDPSKMLCTTYFGKETVYVTQETIDKTKEILDTIYQSLINLGKEVVSDKELKDFQKDILISEIRKNLILMEIHKRAIYFEAEKGGFQSLSKEQRTQYVQEIDNLQSTIYGPKISEVPLERQNTINHVMNLYNKNKGNISPEEINFFETTFLKDFGGEFKPEIKVKGKEKKSIDGRITVEEAKDVLNKILQIIGLQNIENGKTTGWKAKLSTENTGISVSNEKKLIKLPAKGKGYTIGRFLELLDHEVFTHAIIGENNDKTFGVKFIGYIESEEGMAYLNENGVKNAIGNIDEKSINIFVCENYDGETAIKLLEIIYKLSGIKTAPTKAVSSFNRAKRFYPTDLPGASLKDTGYLRGFRRVVEMLKNATPEQYQTLMKQVYFGKMPKEYYRYIDQFQQDLGIKSEDLQMPIFIGAMIYRKLKEGKGALNKMAEEDIRYSSMQKLNLTQCRQLVEILDFFREKSENSKK